VSPPLAAVLLVAAVACSLSPASPATRSISMLAGQIAAATPRARVRWVAGLVLAVPAYTVWTATRTGLWLSLAVLSWTVCKLTSVTAMDGRAVWMARTAGGRT
jgi:hypothetical protein